MVRNEYKSIVLGFCGGGGPGKQLPLMLWLAVEAVVSGKKGREEAKLTGNQRVMM